MVKFRKMSTAQIKQLGDKLSQTFAIWLSDAKPSQVWQTCASCHHVRKEGSIFCNRFNLVPPVAIIVGDRDCEAYSDEAEIPF